MTAMLRYEYKYLLPMNRIDGLRRRLLPFVRIDNFARFHADHQYTVRSIYYESPDFSCYHEKLAGIERRLKVRIRGYNQARPENLVFLELKRKYGPFIGKNRAPVAWSELLMLLSDYDIERHIRTRRSFEEGKQDAHRFFHNVIARGMRPAILIVYEREAFFTTFDHRVRLTFDKNIRFRSVQDPCVLFSDQSLKPLFRNHFVFELKFFDSLPEWLADVVAEFQMQRTSVSKYVLSFERAQISSPNRPVLRMEVQARLMRTGYGEVTSHFRTGLRREA
jgi:hypothetical protein